MSAIALPGCVVVTGASRGIGAEIACGLAFRGVAVCINHRNSPNEAEALATQLRTAGASCAVVQADVADEAAVERLFAEAEAALGPIGGLVNNAGFVGQAGRRIDTIDIDTLRKSFEVNAIGPILCARAALKRISTRHGGKGGRIVNISSIAARVGSANDWVDYAASKGALDSFTLGLGREVAKEGVRVNGVAPGGVETEIHARAGAPDRLQRIAQATPIGRAARAEEIAQVALWLLLDAPDYVNATTIDVAGGL